jgi:6-phosphogluconolactonase (cycloisomerase 2 family)
MNHSGHRIGFAVATGAGGAETLSAHAPLALRRMPARALAAAALVAVAAILAFTLTGGHSPAVSTSAAPATAAQGWSFVPLAEQTSVSGSLGAQLPAFWAVRASTGAVSLHNSAQGLSATLERGAIALSGNHGLSLGLAALSLGRAGTLAPVSALGAAQVTHNRIVFSSAAISEWFVNGPRGLEQGFTLARRPAGSGSLEISQQLSGDLSARVSASGHEVSFSSAAGALRYENLSVTDARGAQIPATLAVTGKRLQITINDAAAVYPLSVDPIIVTPVTQNPIANATTGADPYWVAFSPNGKLLATANYTDSTVSVFTVDPASGQVAPVTQALASNADTASGPFSVAFSPNGKLLATASFSNDEVSLFSIDPSSGQLTPVVQSVAANADTGSGPLVATFSPNGELLATANYLANTVSTFSVASTGQLTPVVQSVAANADTGSGPCSLAFSPNGDLLATANFGDNTASVLAVDPSSGQLTPVTQSVATNADTGVGPYSVAFSPSGGLLATANYDSDTLSLFTVAATSGQLTPVTQTVAANADTGSGPVSVAFSPNWGLLATANYDSDTVSLFTVDAATGQLTPVSESPASNENTGTRPVGVAFSPNGGLLATANLSDDSLSVYTVTGPSAHAALALAPSSITADGVASTLATVTLTDANGNPVSGDTVTFTSTGSQLIGPVTAGTTPGTYTARITSTTTAGTVSITATDTSVGGITASQTLTQTPGAATAVALTLAPASITANGLSTSVATATVTDAHGNRVSGDAVTIRSNDGQQIGPVTAGTTPGTYEATITSTTTPGGAAITATDTSAGALAAVATLTQTSLPPAINAPPAQIAAASTFKIVSHKRLADGDIVVTLKLTGAGTIKAAGMHPSAHTAKDSHIAWGPVTVVRTKAGLFKVTLRPDKGAKLLISNARSIGSSLHVTVTVHFNPAKGSKQKKVLTVLLFKGRKL